MKVLNLRCSNGHSFEGWFGSDDDFMQQNGSGLLQCPVCSDAVVTRMPSAPRLNLSGAREPRRNPDASANEKAKAPAPAPAASAPGVAPPGTAVSGEAPPAELQAAWLHAVRELMQRTEDVGERFVEEARRIHYGETEARGIRGQATAQEREALREEGIETVAVPVPAGLAGPLQ